MRIRKTEIHIIGSSDRIIFIEIDTVNNVLTGVNYMQGVSGEDRDRFFKEGYDSVDHELTEFVNNRLGVTDGVPTLYAIDRAIWAHVVEEEKNFIND